MPSGIRIKPKMNGPGRVRKARMPTYGFSVWPLRVVGSRKSQKTVEVVTNATPAMLIQLLER